MTFRYYKKKLTRIEIKPREQVDLKKDFLDKIQNIALQHISDADFSVDAFAREMNMSRTKLYNELKRYTGFSIKEYLREIRIEYAARLLMETQRTISDIASDTGFESRAFFNLCFKRRFGITPTEYRKKIK